MWAIPLTPSWILSGAARTCMFLEARHSSLCCSQLRWWFFPSNFQKTLLFFWAHGVKCGKALEGYPYCSGIQWQCRWVTACLTPKTLNLHAQPGQLSSILSYPSLPNLDKVGLYMDNKRNSTHVWAQANSSIQTYSDSAKSQTCPLILDLPLTPWRILRKSFFFTYLIL